jgi:hypothetical protein
MDKIPLAEKRLETLNSKRLANLHVTLVHNIIEPLNA